MNQRMSETTESLAKKKIINNILALAILAAGLACILWISLSG